MSDLHLEFKNITQIISLETDKNGVLVLAGDICPYVHKEILLNFLRIVSIEFKHVLYVLGNHEFYEGGSLSDGYNIIRGLIKNAELNNVHLLEKQQKTLGGIVFFGATLWTDFCNNNMLAMQVAKREMADYRQICLDAQKPEYICPEDLYLAHNHSRLFLFRALKKAKSQGKKVVLITHHGVSEQSIHPRYKNNMLNGSFVSELSNEIMSCAPDLIIHGHVHDCFDYTIGKTRVIVNPRGYPNENKFWQECLTVEL